MNALQRLQETQETLQGVAARLLIDLSDMTVPEQAGVVATQAIKLHDELVNARTALADMERQRDEALNRASALEDEYADSDGQWKDATGLLVGGDPDGVTPGHLRRHIQRADRTIAAWKRCAKKYRAMVRGYEEAVTKPRERVEPSSGSPLPRIELMKGSVWTAKGMQERLNGTDWLPRMEVLTAVGDLEAEISTLRARAEKAEREIDRLGEVIHTFRLERDGERSRAEKAEQELERFQRADVGERVREIRGSDASKDRAMARDVMRLLADKALKAGNLIDVHDLGAQMCGEIQERAELLSIVRQQAAEIERLKVGADADHVFYQRASECLTLLTAAGMGKPGKSNCLVNMVEEIIAERDMYVRAQANFAKCCQGAIDESRSHLSAIRERVEKMETFDYHTGFEELLPMADGDYLKRSEVLSALGVVKDSLTTERKPVCSHCNDTHQIGQQPLGREVWCTRCQRPCKEKCHDGNGYCRQTPCPCDCHKAASEAKP